MTNNNKKKVVRSGGSDGGPNRAPNIFWLPFLNISHQKSAPPLFIVLLTFFFLVITQKIRQNFRPSPFGESWISQWWEIIHAHSSFLEHTNPLINKLKVLSKLMTSMNCKQQYLCVSIIKKKFFPQNFLTIHALLIRTLLNNLIFLLAQKSLRHHRPYVWNKLPSFVKQNRSPLKTIEKIVNKHPKIISKDIIIYKISYTTRSYDIKQNHDITSNNCNYDAE